MPYENYIADRHMRSCERFGQAVTSAAGKWDRATPCPEWDARGVLEHVIGFHDVLLLRPMGAKPDRPRNDPLQRWLVTSDALRSLLRAPGLFDGPIDIPPVANNPASQLEAAPLVVALTQDVVVHTWDLARAVGADDRLDRHLCEHFLRRLPDDAMALVATGMFGPPGDVPLEAEPQARLLARLGRDPNWSPPEP